MRISLKTDAYFDVGLDKGKLRKSISLDSLDAHEDEDVSFEALVDQEISYYLVGEKINKKDRRHLMAVASSVEQMAKYMRKQVLALPALK